MPVGVAKLLLRCLSVEPDDRPTMQELAVELAAVIPATEDAPSGGAILLHIAPHFLSSSPDHARTIPRAALANPDLVAAQLWPPVNVAAAPIVQYDPRLPSSNADPKAGQVASQERAAVLNDPRILAPVARVSASMVGDANLHASPFGAAAASAPSPIAGEVAAPALVETNLAAASLPTAPAPVDMRDGSRRPRAPVISALPTGLISQKHIAQNPPVEPVSPVPRVRSVVAAAEIDLARGTPGPEPYAHRELPAVVVSTTQLSIAGAHGTEAPAPPKRVPEQPPVLILPQPVRQRSRLKHGAIGVAVVGVFIATATFVRSWHGSPVVERQREEGSAPATETRPGGLVTLIDAGAIPEEPRVPVTASPAPVTVTELDGGRVPSSVDAPAAPGPVNRTRDQADAPTATPQVKPPSSPETGRVASSRASQSQKTLRARQAEARSTGAKTGSLHVLVTPWAVCWIDGERIDQTPCMLDDLPVGRYRVRLENGVMRKVETLTATVTSGETTTIERAW
jgi:hypothetical protein